MIRIPNKQNLTITTLYFLLTLSGVNAQGLEQKLQDQEKLYLEEKTKLEDLRFEWIRERLKKVGLPTITDKNLKNRRRPVFHPAFYLNYNEEHEQANWVTHMILPQIFEFCQARTEDFREDPGITTGSATDILYSGLKRNDIDRGHLAPAADLRWSERAVSASFFYSNMSPQKSALNQGKWADLEIFIRSYAQFYDTPLYVVTGPVLKDLNNTIVNKLDNHKDGVSIPERYFKVVMDLKRGRGIGFILNQNTTKRKSFNSLAMSIDEVESEVGIDFFDELSKTKGSQVEAQQNLELWDVYSKVDQIKAFPEDELPAGSLNTDQLKEAGDTMLDQEVTVIGKVIDAYLDETGGYLNMTLDKRGKKTMVYIRIEKEHLPKFDHPMKEFRALTVKVKGTLKKRTSFGNKYYYVVIEDPEAIDILML